ncbi:MAG: hypothetical protein HC844_15915 [Tabrizicola sp.]|nr:hypothetical protein [Tabrizicola sp.]
MTLAGKRVLITGGGSGIERLNLWVINGVLQVGNDLANTIGGVHFSGAYTTCSMMGPSFQLPFRFLPG